MKWKGYKIKNLEHEDSDKSDPFLIFYKKQGDSYLKIHRTEIVTDNYNPDFRRFCLRAEDLYDSLQSQFLVRCYDWEEDHDCDLIGETLLTMEDFKKGKKEF